MNNPIQPILALLVTTGYFSLMFYLLKWGYPSENKDALNALLGVLTTIWTLQMNYFFGSTSSNKAKDDTISEIAKSNPMGTGTGVTPVNIPNADNVTVKTNQGDINVTSKDIPI